MHRVVALCLDGLVAFDLTAPAQAFGLAARPGGEPLYEFSTCSVDGGEVRTTSGFGVSPSAGLGALRGADTVVVPAYAGVLEPPPAAGACRAPRRRPPRRPGALGLHRRLRARPRRPARRPPRRHPLGLGRRAGPRASPRSRSIPTPSTSTKGEVMTSAGLSAGIDLSLHVIRKDFGAAAGERVARQMVAAPHREGGQAQFFAAERRPRPAARWRRPGAGPPSASGSRSTSPRWRPRRGQPPHLRPPLPRGDRDDAAAVAARPARPRGAAPAGGVRPAGRDDRLALRLRHRRLAARPLPPRHHDDADGLQPHLRPQP